MSEIEQFPPQELRTLRDELRTAGLDTFQCGSLLTAFLSAKGYGASPTAARDAVIRLESSHHTLPHLQHELELLAMVM